MLRKKIRRLVKLSLLLVLLLVSLILLSNFLIQKPSVQDLLIARLSRITGYRIHTRLVLLNLWGGIGLFVHGLEAFSDRGTESIGAKRVRIIFDAGQLLRGRLVPARIYLIEPSLRLTLPNGRSGPGPGPGIPSEKVPLFWLPGLESISVENGRVSFRGRPFDLRGLHVNARMKSQAPAAILLTSRGIAGLGEKEVPFRLSGTLSQTPGDNPFPSLDMNFETGPVPLSWAPWPASLPVSEGLCEARLKVSGTIGRPISVNGLIGMQDLRFSILGEARKKDYALPRLNLDFKSVIDGWKLKVPSMALTTQDLALSLTVDLDLEERSDPFLALEARCPGMTLRTFKGYFPTPLLASWIENRLFPILQKGEIRMNGLTMKGRLSQFQDLGNPRNRSAFGLDLSCRGFEVSGRGIELPFRDVSAEVTFEDGDFTVSGLNAGFGEASVLRKSGLKVTGIAWERPGYEALVDGSFDLHELMQQKGMDIIPPDVIQKLDQMEPLSGRLTCRATFRYEDDWPFPRTEQGMFVFRDLLIEQKALRFPLSLKEAQFFIDKEEDNRFAGTGSWGKSTFKATGVFGDAEKRFSIQWANLSARMDMNEVMPLFYPGKAFPLRFGDPLPCRLYITNVGDRWSCQGRVDPKGVTLETDRFIMRPPGGDDRVFFDLDFHRDGRIDMKEIQAQFSRSTMTLSGFYYLKYANLFAFKLSAPSLSLEDLGIRFRLDGAPAEGTIGCTLNVRTSPEDPLDTRVTGEIEGRNLYLDLDRFSSPVRDCSFRWDFSEKTVEIPRWQMKVGESPFRISGKLTGWDGLLGEVAIESEFLDTTDLWTKERGSLFDRGHSRLSGFMEKTRIHITLNILRGQWKKMAWGPLGADLDWMGKGLYLRQARVQLEHGLLDITGHMQTGKDPEMVVSSHIDIRDQPLTELLRGIGRGGDENIQGALTLEALLFMQGKGREDLLPSLTGNANILVNEGVIRKSSVLLSILDFLSLQNVFKKRPPELSKEGFYFESIGGHATIDRGVLDTDNAVMKSPVMNAVASGEVDLVKKTLNFNLGIQPLETIDTLVSSIPILGHILTGEEKSILTYYFRATGPLSKPEVTYVPFKNLGSGVAGALKRLFLTPVRLFKNLSSAAKKLSREESPGAPEEKEGDGP